MNRRTFTPTRVGMLLLITVLALGIGLALAQTQGVSQPPIAAPAGVAQAPADTPDKPAQFSAEEAKAEPAEEAEAASEEPEAAATTASAEAAAPESIQGRTVSRMRSTTQAQRQAAARNLAERIVKQGPAAPRAGTPGCTVPLGTPCVQVNYFGSVPNYALSKLPTITPSSAAGVLPVTYTVTAGTGIRKFFDTLPGLGPANKNNLGNYIP